MTRTLAMTTALTTTLAAGSLAFAETTAQNSETEALDAAQHTRDAVSETTEQAREASSEAYDRARNEAADLANRAENAAHGVAETAQDAGERAAGTAASAYDAAKEAASDAYTSVERWWENRTGDADADEGFEKVALQNIDAEKLEGARAYDMTDKWIGEVSEVMLTADKTIDTLHIDVGGLVGIGEHRVSMGPEQIIVTANEDTGDMRVHIFSTKELLMEQPEVEG